jgi:hypothetical protein
MDVCGRAAFGELFDFDETFCDRAAECGHRSFVIMAGAFDGLAVKAAQLSHEDVTGVGYGICTFYPGEKDESRHFLKQYLGGAAKRLAEKRAQEDPYVQLARKSVEYYILHHRKMEMPEDLPERLEAGTVNVPGFAGLTAGLRHLERIGTDAVYAREHGQLLRCVSGLKKLGFRVFEGPHQAATVSFLPGMDCEEAAAFLADRGIAVRAGLHCAPFAHESAGTLETGTVRVSFGHDASDIQTDAFLREASKLPQKRQ